jgi:hypothetical protein
MSWKCFAVAALTLCALVSGAQIAHTQIGTWAQIDAQGMAEFARNKSEYEPAIGKIRWVKGEVRLCPEPNDLMPECVTIAAPRRLLVDRIEPGIHRLAVRTVINPIPYCHATSDDALVGYAMCSGLLAGTTDADPALAAAECKRQGGKPRIGASAKLVEACWGKPLTIKRRETASGVTDKYIYDGGRSVLLHNGVVVTIRTLR